jgi:hypothetical protein
MYTIVVTGLCTGIAAFALLEKYNMKRKELSAYAC